MSTPYVSVQMLNDAPTGVPWNQFPDIEASAAAQAAEQLAIIWRSTSIVDTFCNQVLRATVANEQLTGPGAPRFGFMPGTDQFMLSMRQWPVSDVLAIQYARNRPPLSWDTVAPTAYLVNHPLIGEYTDTASATTPDGGSSIQLDPRALDGGNSPYGLPRGRRSRNSLRLLVSYTNGWPHTSLTEAVDADATSLPVDDVTGWTGAAGFVYDGSATEAVSATGVSATTPLELPNGVGTAQTGPGTITLASPLGFTHAAGTMVTSLPANVIQATILVCVVQALESGVDAVTAEGLPGSITSTGGGTALLRAQYMDLLTPYRRII